MVLVLGDSLVVTSAIGVISKLSAEIVSANFQFVGDFLNIKKQLHIFELHITALFEFEAGLTTYVDLCLGLHELRLVANSLELPSSGNEVGVLTLVIALFLHDLGHIIRQHLGLFSTSVVLKRSQIL
jgi:hypothetical protein